MSCCELRDLFSKSCCLVVLHECLYACRWYDLPLEVYPRCDSRSRHYGKKRGWSTHKHSKCASLVCTTKVDSHASIQSSKNIPGKVKAHEVHAQGATLTGVTLPGAIETNGRAIILCQPIARSGN